jgi:hypothetical protein
MSRELVPCAHRGMQSNHHYDARFHPGGDPTSLTTTLLAMHARPPSINRTMRTWICLTRRRSGKHRDDVNTCTQSAVHLFIDLSMDIRALLPFIFSVTKPCVPACESLRSLYLSLLETISLGICIASGATALYVSHITSHIQSLATPQPILSRPLPSLIIEISTEEYLYILCSGPVGHIC